MKNLITFLLLSWGSLAPLCAQSTFFVKHDATGLNDGSSWTDAYTNLQSAINAAIDDDQIWVTAGVYKPTADNPASTDNTTRDRSFFINKKINIYGGFVGTENTVTQRDWITNETILSGDLGTSGVDTDNALHVVFFDARSTPFNFLLGASIDGFTVEKGNANKTSFMSSRGGGVFNNGELNSICFSIITNCKFIDNKAGADGGAIFNAGYSGTCSPQIASCTFDNNVSANNGGAIYNDGTDGRSNPYITECIFINNMCSGSGGGGAIFNDGAFNGICSPTILNSHFSNNSAGYGGAIYNGSTFDSGIVEPQITNCWFVTNTASIHGGAMSFFDNPDGEMKATITNCVFQNNGTEHISYDDGAANMQPHFINCIFYGATAYSINIVDFTNGTPIDFTNCIFWGNNNDITNGTLAENNRVNINYSIVEEMSFAPSNNNINADPIFVDASTGDFHLDTDSPAFDVGENAAIPSGITTDLDGNPRIENTVVNIGAFEGVTLTSLPISYVNFAGKALDQSNLLEWSVSDEHNTSTYFIQRSTDGQHFESIGSLVSTPTHQLSMTYKWEDKHVLSQAYYQILALDKDGKKYNSNVIFLKREATSSVIMESFYPNPVQNTAFLNFYAAKDNQLELQINNAIGQVIFQEEVNIVFGQNQIKINTKSFPVGQYWLRLMGQDGTLSVQQFVVK